MTAKESGMKDTGHKPPIFAREATGLIRNFSWREIFLISAGIMGLTTWSPSSQAAYVIGAAPGADIVLSTFIGFLISVPLGVVYYYLAVVMPRSGGDYVWVSRIGHPIIGFLAGWGYWFACNFLQGVIVFLIAIVEVPVFLVTLGYGLGNAGLVSMSTWLLSSNTNVVAVALVFLVFSYAVAGIDPKIFSRVLTVMFILILISIVGTLGVLATSTHADFVNAINGYGGTNLTYNGVISQATAAGWSYAPVTWGMTLLSIPMSILLYNGFTYSVAASGEVKNPKKSMLIGIIGCLAVGMIVDMVGIGLGLGIFGYDFLQASTFLSSNSAWPLSAPPWMALLTAPLIKNAALLVIIQIGWMLSLPWLSCALALVCTRYTFAFAFDRVLPVRFSNINDRFHFPVNASILCFILGAIFTVVAVYEGYVSANLNMVALWCILWILASFVAIILPATRFKELGKTLPGANWPVPALSIWGVASLIAMIIVFYYSVTNPAIGPSTTPAQLLLGGIFAVGLLVYIASYYYNKKLGIDLKNVYSEIPPE